MHDIRNGTCPLCAHNRIIEAWPADHNDTGTSSVNLSVTESVSWRGTVTHGALIAYLCQRCGFTQWFTSGVDQIPIGEKYRTKVIEGPR